MYTKQELEKYLGPEIDRAQRRIAALESRIYPDDTLEQRVLYGAALAEINHWRKFLAFAMEKLAEASNE